MSGAKRIVKIAPGHNAKFWDECLKEGFICVGWDAVGDLRQFESEASFKSKFADDVYNLSR